MKIKRPYIKPEIKLEIIATEEPLAASSQTTSIEILGPGEEDTPFQSWDEITSQKQDFNW